MSDTGSYRDKRLSFIAVLALLVALAAAAALVVGAYGYRTQMWGYGFALLTITQYAAYAGVAAAVLGLIGLGATLPGGARRGVVTSLLAIIVGGGAGGYVGDLYWTVRTVPYIHDISTDLDNPPRFVATVPLRVAAGAVNPPEHQGAEVALQQRAGYPDLGPLMAAVPPDEVFEKVLALIENRGWELVEADSQAGRIEAIDTSRFYQFKDDIVIRLTPSGEGTTIGTRIDMRSKSRVGRSDVGVNAVRIKQFLADLERAVTT